MATDGPFKPLFDTKIRLLRIHQGTGKDDLSCSLEKHDVEAGNQLYTAISYAWGPPEDSHFPCYVDSFRFSIRQNAFKILRILQKADRDVWVWLDALCINQNDKTEKGAQIRLMYRIYKQAESTAIWLGEADDSTEHVVNYANTLDLEKIMNECVKSNKSNYQNKSFILLELASHRDKITLVNGIARLFHAMWFSRVWIRQEGAIGGNPYALRGPYSFTWTQLTVLAFLFQPRFAEGWPDWVDFRFNEIEPALVTVITIDHYRGRERDGGSSVRVNPLFEHIVQARTSLTEKPHDKVYALSSMATDLHRDSNDAFLKPDYHLSWQEVYVNTAKLFFKQNHVAYQVLEQAGLVHQGVNTDLPSWVPDWRYPAVTQIISLSEWVAGGDHGHVRTKVTGLNKIERQRLLTYRGAASILPLFASLSKDKQQLKEEKLRLEETKSQTQNDNLQAKERLHLQEKWLKVRQSALKAALVLEISVSMQDTIKYLSPRPSWFYEDDLKAYREEITGGDNQNLEFLKSREKDLYITSEPLRQAYNATLISSQDHKCNHASANLVAEAEEWRTWLKDGDLTSRPRYHTAIENSFVFRDRSFAWTENGYMALVPSITQLGDHVVVFPGYQTPFVIRPVLEWYMLVGMCYVHGMMRSDTSILIEEFNIKFENGKSKIRRPQGDVRANGLKYPAGCYVDILETLGKRFVKLI